MSNTHRQAVRKARRLTAWLNPDMAIASVVRGGLSDQGVDVRGAVLLVWDQVETGIFAGAFVDIAGRRYECTFHWDPDTDHGRVGALRPVPEGIQGTRFDWSQLEAAVSDIRRLEAEPAQQRRDRLDAFEERLGVRLPEDYRAFMVDHDGWFGWTGSGDWLDLVSIDELDDSNVIPQVETHHGLLVIGSDGGRELVGFDNRKTPPPIVLVQVTSPGWEKVVVQAPSFSAFRAQLDETGYRFE